jgi:hypothetical protein
VQRNGQKRFKKKIDGKRRKEKSFFSQLFRPKCFDINLSQKVFYGVFELSLVRNAQKSHQKISKLIKKRGTYPDTYRFLQNICTQIFLFFFLLPRSWVVPAKQIAFSFFFFPESSFLFIGFFLPARASILAQRTSFSTPAGAFMPAQPQGFSTPARASILAQPQGFRTWRGFTYTILGKTPARPA